jgi:hypothetical protein
LNRIQSVIAVAEDADRVAHSLRLIPFHQMAKCLPLSRSARSYRVCIVHLCLSL